jgi:hypothetical protein
MSLSRWGALFGLLAAVLLVAGVVISGDTPDGDADDQEWINYVQDDESLLLIRAYLFVGAAVSLLAFYSFGVRPRLGEVEVTDRALAGLGAGATLLAGGAFIFAGLIGAAVGAAHIFADIPVDPSIARLFDNLMYGGLVVAGALPLGVVMAVVAIQTRRRGAFPQWILWVSVLGIIGMAASVIFLPFVLAPIWLIAVSVVLFRRGSAPAVA